MIITVKSKHSPSPIMILIVDDVWSYNLDYFRQLFERAMAEFSKMPRLPNSDIIDINAFGRFLFEEFRWRDITEEKRCEIILQ